MVYLEFPPDPFLSRYVECFWMAESQTPPFQPVEALIPEGTIELMFNMGDPYWRIDPASGEKEPVKGCHIIGFRKESLYIAQTANQKFFCVRFKPGGLFPFTKVPVSEFTQTILSAEDIFGLSIKETADKIYHAGTAAERIRIIQSFLYQCFVDKASDYLLISECITHNRAMDRFSVDGLSRETGYSLKFLERKFKKVIGVPPNRFFQILQFNGSVKKIMSGTYSSLTAIAYDSGYYDQAHFIKKFRSFTDSTPMEFIRKKYTIVKVIQPSLAKRLSDLNAFHS